LQKLGVNVVQLDLGDEKKVLGVVLTNKSELFDETIV